MFTRVYFVPGTGERCGQSRQTRWIHKKRAIERAVSTQDQEWPHLDAQTERGAERGPCTPPGSGLGTHSSPGVQPGCVVGTPCRGLEFETQMRPGSDQEETEHKSGGILVENRADEGTWRTASDSPKPSPVLSEEMVRSSRNRPCRY